MWVGLEDWGLSQSYCTSSIRTCLQNCRNSWTVNCCTSKWPPCLCLLESKHAVDACRRPYFTYWLMLVHVIIMIVALILYGFAPYGWDQIEQRQLVRQTDLSFATTSRLVVPSVWLGPPQQALVLLGALFAPCMRRDRQIFEAIDMDRETEGNASGCCVRRDMSGCFQALNENCQVRKGVCVCVCVHQYLFADEVF